MSNLLGYYSDADSTGDTESFPAQRPSNCINCKRHHYDHFGWGCRREDDGKDFDDITSNYRYVTHEMMMSRGGRYAQLNRITEEAKKLLQPIMDQAVADVVAKPVDTSDWRTWAKVGPGECACKIPRHQCIYHKDQ